MKGLIYMSNLKINIFGRVKSIYMFDIWINGIKITFKCSEDEYQKLQDSSTIELVEEFISNFLKSRVKEKWILTESNGEKKIGYYGYIGNEKEGCISYLFELLPEQLNVDIEKDLRSYSFEELNPWSDDFIGYKDE